MTATTVAYAPPSISGTAPAKFNYAIGYLKALVIALVVALHAVLAYHPSATPPPVLLLDNRQPFQNPIRQGKGCRRSASNPPLWLRCRWLSAHLDLLPRANVEVKDRAEFEAENHSGIRRAGRSGGNAPSFDR
jgi:hypothetical protein